MPIATSIFLRSLPLFLEISHQSPKWDRSSCIIFSTHLYRSVCPLVHLLLLEGHKGTAKSHCSYRELHFCANLTRFRTKFVAYPCTLRLETLYDSMYDIWDRSMSLTKIGPGAGHIRTVFLSMKNIHSMQKCTNLMPSKMPPASFLQQMTTLLLARLPFSLVRKWSLYYFR